MQRTLVAIVIAEALLIAVLAYFLAGREGGRGDRPRTGGARAAVEAPEAPLAEETRASRGAAAPSSPRAPLDGDAVVWGKVADRGGSPPRDGTGWVTFRAESGESRTAQVQAGSYAIAGLAPGAWTAIAGVRGWKGEERAVEIAPGPSRIDFELKALTRIAVRFVTPAGTPLVEEMRKLAPQAAFFGPPLYAVATRDPPPARLPMTELRLLSPYGEGEWVSQLDGEKLPSGADGLLLVGDFPVHVSAVLKHIVLRTAVVHGPVEELVFTIPCEEATRGLTTVRARFVDAATNAPIKGARAGLCDRQSGGGDVQTNDDGRVVLAHRMPGLMYLTLHAYGYEAFQTYVPIREGGELDLGTFRVAPAETVMGKVVDPAGKGVAGCSILLRNVEHLSPPQPLSGQYFHQSGAEGTFEANNAGRARYLLVASAKGWATHAQILDVPAGGVQGLEIRLRPGVLVTVASRLAPERHCLLTVADEQGTVFSSALATWRWPISWRLAPGTYRLKARDDDGVVDDIPFTVGSKPLTVTVGG